jgi:hypothetical protein
MSWFPWRGPDNTTYKFEREPGDDAEATRPIHGLPTAVVAAIASSASSLVTAVASLASISGFVDGIEGKLDTLIERTPITGSQDQATIGTGSAALPDMPCEVGCWVKNVSTGSQKINIKQGATSTLTNGWLMSAGDAEHFFPCSNANELQAISTAVSGQVSIHAI